jgi:hypothetical protein
MTEAEHIMKIYFMMVYLLILIWFYKFNHSFLEI